MNIEIFKNPEFGEVRVATNSQNQPIFCASDVARALGYADPKDAVARHCKSGEEVFHPHANGIGGTKVRYIEEPDLYRLIMRSKLPTADKFQDWVCEEVLPSIRKQGIYATPAVIDQILNNPDFIIELLNKYKEAKANEQRLLLENQKIEQEVADAKEEIKLCDRTITHLTEHIDINDMRQTLNEIMRRVPSSTFAEAWQHLYREFQKKYHLNIGIRKNFYNKYRNYLDYIDKELHMVPELYELACALFSSEYETVKKRWEKGTKSGNMTLRR